MTVLLVVNKMLNRLNKIINIPSFAEYSRPIALRNILVYTTNNISRIIVLRLTILLNTTSTLLTSLFEHKTQLMSCTLSFYLLNQQVKIDKDKKNIRYNN